MEAKAIVRKAKPGDIAGIKAIIDEFAFQSDHSGQLIPVKETDILELVDSGSFYVAAEGAKIVGCASVVVYSMNHGSERQVAELRSLAVIPPKQGKGIGGELVEKCIYLAAQREYSALYALTQPEHFNFFRSHKFSDADIPLEKRASYCHICPNYNNGCVEKAFMIGFAK